MLVTGAGAGAGCGVGCGRLLRVPLEGVAGYGRFSEIFVLGGLSSAGCRVSNWLSCISDLFVNSKSALAFSLPHAPWYSVAWVLPRLKGLRLKEEHHMVKLHGCLARSGLCRWPRQERPTVLVFPAASCTASSPSASLPS